MVKANQPALHHQLKIPPWQDIPVADCTRDPALRRNARDTTRVLPLLGLTSP
jgi:hypothetical protein